MSEFHLWAFFACRLGQSSQVISKFKDAFRLSTESPFASEILEPLSQSCGTAAKSLAFEELVRHEGPESSPNAACAAAQHHLMGLHPRL